MVMNKKITFSAALLAAAFLSHSGVFLAEGAEVAPPTSIVADVAGGAPSATSEVVLAAIPPLGPEVGVKFQDDFTNGETILDLTKWIHSKTGPTDIQVEAGGGVFAGEGQSGINLWAGRSIRTTDGFSYGPTSLKVTVERPYLNLVAGTGVKSGVFLSNADQSNFFFLSDGLPDEGWAWSVNSVGSGNPISAFAPMNDGLEHVIELAYDGTAVDMYLDGVYGGRIDWVCSTPVYVELGFYTHQTGDAIQGAFGPIVVENVDYKQSLVLPGDIARPINSVKEVNRSSYPAAESPAKVIDGDVGTKYLNFGGENTGFIVTPGYGKSTVKSFKMWTANDANERDPDTYQIYGTDDVITSTDNGFGDGENWTLIQSGTVALPTDRQVAGPLVSVNNSVAYSSYKVLFPSLRKDGNALMQLADIQLYTDAEGTQGILSYSDSIIAVQPVSTWSHLSGEKESSQHSIDGDVNTKYYSGMGAYSGVIFLPSNPKTIVKSMVLTTANDFTERDPASFELYGTNEEVVSKDYSLGNAEEWTLIASGNLDLPLDRITAADPIVISSGTVYSAYKVIFPTLRVEGTPSMQISEIQLLGAVVEAAPVSLITPADTMIGSGGSFPEKELPQAALDRVVGTKYLNFGGAGSGFIVTTAGEPFQANYFMYTTANDSNDRDPLAFEVFGSNDAIDGAETWTPAGTGVIQPSLFRFRNTAPAFFANGKAYSSYKVIFTQLRGSSMFQIAEVYMYCNVEAPALEEVVVQSGVEGDKLTFTAVASGTEPLEYQWYKDGEIIEGATGSSYVIENASLADTAAYSVSVGNSKGSDESLPQSVVVSSNSDNLALLLDFVCDEAEGDATYDLVTGTPAVFTDPAPAWSDSAPSRQFGTKYSAYDYSLEFAGDSGAMFSTEDIDIDPASPSMTIDFWFQGIEPKESWQEIIGIYGNSKGTCPVLAIDVDMAGYLAFYVGYEVFITGVLFPNDSEWHNMVLVNNAPAKIFYVYLDGVLLEGFQYPDTILTFPTVEEGYGNIGCYIEGIDPYGYEDDMYLFLNGNLDRIRVWSGVLGPNQMDIPPADPIPPFYYDDVNYTGDFKGSVAWDEEADTYTVKGSGADVWGSSDQFFYVYNPIPGGTDFDISVKFDSFQAPSDGWAKAGLMVREGNAEGNQIGNARHFSTQTQRLDSPGNSSFWSSWRTATGGNVSDNTAATYGTLTFPHWQRIVSVDGIFYSLISTDGEKWNLLAAIDTKLWEGGVLGSENPLYVGMWVTSHNSNSNDATASFSDLELSVGYVPMEIIIQPTSVTTVAGARASIRALAIGTDINLQWFKNGEALEDFTGSSFYCYATPWDAGDYHLAVYQNNGFILSDVVTLTVNPATEPNAVQAWVYDNPNPGNLDKVKAAFRNYTNPNLVLYLTQYLETPTDRADNYCSSIAGLLTPPETGTYYFYIASDDQSQLWLSSDATPANLGGTRTCEVTGWAPSRKYNQEANQKSVAVNLVAGKDYYFEVFHVEGSGGDNLSVAWATPSMGDVLPTLPIEAKYIKPYRGAPPTILGMEVPIVVEGNGATLTVEAKGAGEITYQWYKNGVAIEGATGSSYTIGQTGTGDAGVYTVGVSNPGGTTMSSGKTLVVSSDPAKLQKLVDFQMDEGQFLETSSSVGNALATFGYNADPGAVVNGVAAPSGLVGDYAAEFNGQGWLLGTFEGTPVALDQPFTWEAWVWRDPLSTKAYEDFFRVGDTIKIGMNTDHVFQATFMGIVDINSEVVVENDIWMHLACAWEPGVGVTFYKNGAQIASVPVTSMPRAYSNNRISLGSDNFGGSIFQGRMDRVRLHAGMLQPSQLDVGVTNPKAPIEGVTLLSYGFNEGQTPYASAGLGNIELLDGAQVMAAASKPVWTEGPLAGKYDHALRFNGSAYAPFNTDGINFGDKSDVSFSMSAWIKDIKVSTSRQVLFQSLGNKAGTAPRVSFSISPAREVFFTTMGIADFNTGIKIPEGTDWHQIAVAYNAPAGIVYVYIDGQLAGTKAYTGGVNFAAQGTDLSGCLGRELGGSLPINGTVDRVTVWKGVLGLEQLDYPPALPVPPYFYEDVNYEGEAPGSLVEAPKGTYAIQGSGNGINGTEDSFFYVYNQAPAGDFDVTVKVESLASVSGLAQTGLMVREADADFGVQAGSSRFFSTLVWNAGTEQSYSGAAWRSVASSSSMIDPSGETAEYPHWQRIVRIEDTLYGLYSVDGENWTVLAEEDTSDWTDGPLGSALPLYIGMWTTSGNEASNDGTAVFSHYNEVKGFVPAEIIVQPESATVCVGSLAGFNVLALGTDLSYTWYHDGLIVPDRYEDTLGTLFATEEAAGTYYVNVTQGTTVLASDEAVLTVVENPQPGLVQVWNYEGPTSISDLIYNLWNFTAPDEVLFLNPEGYFETPENHGTLYGSVIVGLITPEETGTYNFYVAADQEAALYLSTTGSPEDVSEDPIAWVSLPTASRQYDLYPEQKSAAIELVAGESYYFELFHNVGAAGDNLSVAWTTPSEVIPVADVVPVLPMEARFLSPYVGDPIPVGHLPEITQQPVSPDVLYTSDGYLTLNVDVTGTEPLTVVWLKDGVETGLTGNTIEVARTTANAGSWTARVTNIVGSTVSDAAVISFREPASGYEALVVSNNPWAYWRLGETDAAEKAVDYAHLLNASFASGNVLGIPGAIAQDTDTAVAFSGGLKNTESYSTMVAPAIGLETVSEATLLCWVKRDGAQTDYTPMMVNRSDKGVFTGLTFVHGNALGYSWGSQPAAWSFNSGLTMADGSWYFAALVVKPTEAVLYLGNEANGLMSAANPVAHDPTQIDTLFTLGGQDNDGTDRLFKGALDEPALFNYALSAEQIQEIFETGLFGVLTDPTLTYKVEGGKLVLSWLVSSRCALEVAPTAEGPWTHAGLPTEVDGTNVYEVELNKVGTGFYRLVR